MSADAERTDEDRLREDAQKVERLLDELQTMVGPNAWQRVEALLHRVTGLYAAGLERIIDHAREAGADEALLAARLCDDQLATSLLLLHGLHPKSPRERIDDALVAARSRLGQQIDLVDLDADGILTLRSRQALPTCPSSRGALERTVADLVIEHAPEVARVQVEDGPVPGGRLIQIGLHRSRGAP